MDTELVWRALASPQRRLILEALRDNPLSTGQLAKALPEHSRFAVMQHLGVLEQANLVLSRREGKRRINYSNAVPIRDLFERWVDPISSRAAETTLHFKRYAKFQSENKAMPEYKDIQIENETLVAIPVDRAFRAYTDGYNDWFPHHSQEGAVHYFDTHPGGTCGERFPNGGGCIHASVLFVDAPNKIVLGGAGCMLDGAQTFSVHEFVANGEKTLFKRRLRIWGSFSDEFETMIREGSRHLIETSFAAYCAQGATS